MIQLVGLPVNQAVKEVEAMGLKAKVKENYRAYKLKEPTLIVTGAREQNGIVVLAVGEFFLR